MGAGLCVLLGIARGDSAADAEQLARRVANLRIFENEGGRFDRSVLETRGAVLVVSQFTLVADYRHHGAGQSFRPGWRGNRPSFTAAAPPEEAQALYEHFCRALRGLGLDVETGVFGARMTLDVTNDGPVTIILDI
jgi:D-tyrosyl-tRNA(Tyr) deacylase